MSILILIFGLIVGLSPEIAHALDVPPLAGRVVDRGHLLDAATLSTLEAQLATHEQVTGNQVAVLTLSSLEGEPLEQFSHRVATTWQLGKKGTDNGVLLLVVPQDRKIRIEIGYGLEGTFTDVQSSRIIRTVIIPEFRKGNYQGGIVSGTRAILALLESGAPPADQAGPLAVETAGHGETLFLAILVGSIIGGLLGTGIAYLATLGGGIVSFLLASVSGLGLALLAGLGGLIGAVVLAALFRGATGRGSGASPWGGPGWPTSGTSGSGWSSSLGSFSGGGGNFGGGGASGEW